MVNKVNVEWKRERGERTEGMKGNVKERLLDAGVHFDVGAHCLFELDRLCFLCPFSLCLFSSFGGVGERRFRVDFGGAHLGFFCGPATFFLGGRRTVPVNNER